MSSQDGESSLMLASQNRHVEVVDKLLQHGARVYLQDNVMFKGFVKYRITKTFATKNFCEFPGFYSFAKVFS